MTNKENRQNNIEMLESASSFKKTNQNGFSPRLTENAANELFPSLTQKPPLSTILEKRALPHSNTSNSSNFNNFQIGSTYLKENLSKKGRCPICTLPIPCKHYESVDDLPKPQPPAYQQPVSTFATYQNPIPPQAMENIWYSNKSHKTTRESSLSNQPSSVPQRHPSETINTHPFHDSDFNRQLPQISPRKSQLDSFLNQGLKAKKSKSNATDANLFIGKSNETTPKEAQLRIRGKSNIIQTQEGSLLFSIYEQRQEQEREKQLKQAKKYQSFIISLGALNYSISLKITDIES